MVAGQRELETGAAEERGGGGYGEQTRTPAADTAVITSARPEHRMSGEYDSIVSEAPKGGHAYVARVAGVDGTTGLSVETESMEK